MPQLWSWKVCVFLVGVAVVIDVLVVQSALVWLAGAGMLAIGAQFWNPISSLAVVIFTCGLLSYSPFEAGVLSRLYPGDLAIGIFIFTWLMRCESWSFKEVFHPQLINRPLLGMAIVTPLSMLWSRFHSDPSVAYNFPHSDVSL